MMYDAGIQLNEAYGKEIIKQQAYLWEHNVEYIYRLSRDKIQSLGLDNIPEILSINCTPSTNDNKLWKILTKKAIPRTTILKIDKQLATSTKTFGYTVYHRKKQAENITPAARN